MTPWLYVLPLLATIAGLAVGALWGYRLGRAHGLRRARGLVAALSLRVGHARTVQLLLDAIDKAR